jgi:hypothetical protein
LPWFQQDGAIAHTAVISKQVVNIMLPGRLIFRIGQITWRDLSTDHAVPDSFLWDYVIIKVYETRPANIANLKQQILECIQGIA